MNQFLNARMQAEISEWKALPLLLVSRTFTTHHPPLFVLADKLSRSAVYMCVLERVVNLCSCMGAERKCVVGMCCLSSREIRWSFRKVRRVVLATSGGTVRALSVVVGGESFQLNGSFGPTLFHLSFGVIASVAISRCDRSCLCWWVVLKSWELCWLM